MGAWSALRPLLIRCDVNQKITSIITKRCMSDHRVLPFRPSRWQWQKFKDYMNFYILIGAIPLVTLITAVNVFVGPATLSEIPPDYEPKHWEYCRHPITRFLVRYVMNSPQQEYEKYLHHLFEEGEKIQIRKLDEMVKVKVAERKDYQVYYYNPVMAKYHRMAREAADESDDRTGD